MKYNSLTFIEDIGKNKHGKRLWKCLCLCGKTTTAIASEVRSGHTKTCGCGKGNKTHGLSHLREYQTWADMKNRCNNPRHKSFLHYGGRGITYDPSWESFEQFYKDMGNCPENWTLERINNNLGYSKDNCIWATRTDQNRNTSRCLKYRGDKEGI